jgi:hypothetical protein
MALRFVLISPLIVMNKAIHLVNGIILSVKIITFMRCMLKSVLRT